VTAPTDDPPTAHLAAITLPDDLTPAQLAALAALERAIAEGRWRFLAASFDRLDAKGGRWPDPMADVLDQLAAAFGRAASERRTP
jgi:hypothetical protein